MDVTGVIQTYLRNSTNVGFKRRENFQKAYEHESIQQNTIFYESFFGKNITDNPLALFEYIFKLDVHHKFTHIWAFNSDDTNGYYQYYKRFSNVKFVEPHSKAYTRALASSKYLITNVSMPFYFVKKEGQIVIDTWHGTPLKTLGREMAGSITQNFNVTRSFLLSDYLLSPNPFTTDKLINSYDINGIFKGKLLESGYPRADILRSHSASPVVDQALTSIHFDPTKKTVLYAPTWRGATGAAEDNLNDLMRRVKSIMNQIDASKFQLLVKVHPLAARYLDRIETTNVTFVPAWLDATQLLAKTDLLITDYSSIFFDYLITNRPIIFYTYDQASYMDERGTYLDLNHLPGEICKTDTEVATAISNMELINERHASTISEFKKTYTPYEDGNACKRVISRIFLQNPSALEHEYSFDNHKPNVVIHAGAFRNNGVTTSLINLTAAFDYNHYNLIVVDKIEADADFEFHARHVDKRAHLVFRGYPFNHTYPQWVAYSRFLNKGILGNLDHHRASVAEEWRRILGDVKMDYCIEFSGYSPLWCYMAAFSPAKRRYIYLHNDMMEEATKFVQGVQIHFQNFHVVFKLYQFFDKLCNVGELTMQMNIQKLGKFTRREQFVYVPNTLDAKAVFSYKRHPQVKPLVVGNQDYLEISHDSAFGRTDLTLITPPTTQGANFINIGRLSPEKGQDRLLRAFSSLQRADNFRHKLYILGDGADADTLRDTAKSLGLGDSVVFVGFTSAGRELLANFDCMVQPSRHEGQPMVLLEAMAIGKPIVATDIPGNRSALAGSGVRLYPDSEAGILQGMKAFVAGKVELPSFDLTKYNQNAIAAFNQLLS